MKLSTKLLAAFILSMCLYTDAQTSAFVGKWKGQTKLPSIELNIIQGERSLAGQATFFDLRGNKREYAILNVVVKGRVLYFETNDMSCSLGITRGHRYGVFKGRRREFELEFKVVKER